MAYVFLSLIGILASGWALRTWHRRRRRSLLIRQPIPDAWADILMAQVPLYQKLPADLKHQLHGLVNVFIDEKRFRGGGGLEVTETMRVSIAAQACILLLNRNTEFYPGFTTILVYPDTYLAEESSDEGLIRSIRHTARSGESWFRGPVVLSWRDTVTGMERPHDGRNVVLHEFAHKLDEEDGRMDGLPLLDEARQYRTWAAVLSREFDALRTALEHRHKHLIDDYGATSAPEFFAVATETFFEKPQAMEHRHPELYAELQQFYQLDPARW